MQGGPPYGGPPGPVYPGVPMPPPGGMPPARPGFAPPNGNLRPQPPQAQTPQDQEALLEEKVKI